MLYSFHHHYRIIDHDTNGKNQAKQSQYIDREAKNQHESKSTNQRNRHRYYRDQCSTPTLQRQIHDQYNQYQCFKQCFIYLMNRLGDIRRHIKRNFIAQSFRKVPADLFHRLFYILGHFHRIGTRQHINTKYSGILTINTTFSIVRRSLQRYTCHIL